jgi:hypothetical protein
VPDADGATAEIEEVQAWAGGLEAMHARIAGRFARAEPRRRVLAYLRGLLGAVTPEKRLAVGRARRRGHPGWDAAVVGHRRVGFRPGPR